VMLHVAKPAARRLDVAATDGTALDAWALTPAGTGPFPTVLAVHGGPASAFGHVFHSDHQLLTGAGFAVVFANFRGSAGYGTQFMQRLDGRWGEVGEEDHHAVLDRAIELGIADPDRLGVYGLSHGGFAVCWLLGRSDRFRAGIAENPLVSFASAYGTMDMPWLVERTVGALPHEAPELYYERSPLPYAASCTTPLLLIVGEEDHRCPPTEAEQYFRALKAVGCEVEMLRMPGCSHLGSWFGPVAARTAQNEALVNWFARHMSDQSAPALTSII
jgi:dipeptidyl aminopeptidase/acylaminoacyl peptidase